MINPMSSTSQQLTHSENRQQCYSHTPMLSKRKSIVDLWKDTAVKKITSPELQQPASPTSEEERQPTPTSHPLLIGLALLALYFIWGSTYLGMRLAMNSFPPFLMAGIRFIIAGVLLYSVMRIRHTPAPTRAQWLGSAVIGILMIGGGNGGVAFAEQWVASGIAAVAIAASPLWTSFFFGFLGRWPTRLEWFGLTLGFIGVILLNLENGLWANPFGALALLLAPVCWSLGSALSFRLSLPSGFMSSATEMLCGGVFLLLLGLLRGERILHPPTALSLAAMAFLILFGSLVAFSAYGYLLQRVRPALATSYAYINPIVAVLLGVWLVNEKITLTGILAMLVILTGVGLVSLRRKH